MVFKVVKSSLANSDDLAGEPYRIRTCDPLVRSYSRVGVVTKQAIIARAEQSGLSFEKKTVCPRPTLTFESPLISFPPLSCIDKDPRN